MFMFVLSLHDITVNHSTNVVIAFAQLSHLNTSEKLQAQYQRIKIIHINCIKNVFILSIIR